ncbi:hypothetical protein EVAR_98049_1 [Eumeta japonica]|uniref:Uncharacterized protein n=1 Tax=Eumeta variegata TaxID=151549 RepID=A0A4C1WFG6_EUMVA|nr:hypothetical protein EVAR_98049_1 [Eumeta japonica]
MATSDSLINDNTAKCMAGGLNKGGLLYVHTLFWRVMNHFHVYGKESTLSGRSRCNVLANRSGLASPNQVYRPGKSARGLDAFNFSTRPPTSHPFRGPHVNLSPRSAVETRRVGV